LPHVKRNNFRYIGDLASEREDWLRAYGEAPERAHQDWDSRETGLRQAVIRPNTYPSEATSADNETRCPQSLPDPSAASLLLRDHARVCTTVGAGGDVR
jgi:hypothetical protein